VRDVADRPEISLNNPPGREYDTSADESE